MRSAFPPKRLPSAVLRIPAIFALCCMAVFLSSPGRLVAAQSISDKIAASKDLLDINTATLEQLASLPGMGHAYAQRVIAGRPYTAKNQLSTRGILPAETYDAIKPLIIAHRVKH